MPASKARAQFRPLKVVDGHVLVSGGYSAHPQPTPYRTMLEGSEKLLFLRMEARENWLIRGACGVKKSSPGLSNLTTLLNELREKLERACDGEATSEPDIRCHGAAPDAAASTFDPMDEVADDVVVMSRLGKPTKGPNVKRTRYYTNHCKNSVLAVSMPQRARETGIDEGERMVQLYCEDRKKIWICTKDADWALAYLRDQLSSKGVIRVDPDDRGPGALPEAPVPEEPPAVAGPLHLEDEVHEVGSSGQVDAGLQAPASGTSGTGLKRKLSFGASAQRDFCNTVTDPLA